MRVVRRWRWRVGSVVGVGALLLALGCSEGTRGSGGGSGGAGGLGGSRGESPKLGWCTPEPIDMGETEHPSETQMTVDTRGNVVAVWQDELGGKDVWTLRWTPDGGWGPAERIPREAAPASRPRLVFDAREAAVAIWPQSDCAGSYDVVSSRWTQEEGWTPLGPVDSADGHALDPELAIDTSGNVFAAWQQYDGGDISVWANRWTAGQGWGTAEQLAANVDRDADLRVAATGSERAIVTWTNPVGDESYPLWASWWVEDEGWSTPELVEEALSVEEYDLAFDPTGYLLLAWSRGNSSGIMSARWAGEWQLAEQVTRDPIDRGPIIAFDANGDARAIWMSSGRWVSTSRWTAGDGWQEEDVAEIPEIGSVGAARLAVDPTGNAILVWLERDGTLSRIWSRRWTPGEGWQEAELLGRGEGWLGDLRTVFDGTGAPHVLWSNAEPGSARLRLWSSHYELGCGIDGTGGAAGAGGAGGAGNEGADPCEGVVCPDAECKSGGQCDSSSGTCVYSTIADDGTACSEGECLAGGCGRVGSFACTEEGLREAVAAGGGPHFFACDEDKPVAFAERLVIDEDVTLDGEGQLVIDRRGGWDDIIHVEADRTVELRGVRVRGGSVFTASSVSSFGSLTVVDSTLEGISSAGPNLDLIDTEITASGVWNAHGVATLTRCRVLSSPEYSNGEGINNRTGSMTVTDSVVSGWGVGEWPSYHGAVYNGHGCGAEAGCVAGQLTLENTTISGNRGIEAGAIHNTGIVTLRNSTVADNVADRGPSIYTGGGTNAVRGTFTMLNSTVSGAMSGYACDSDYNGYAIGNRGLLTMTNSTLAGNAFGALNNWGDATVTNSVLDGGCVQLGDDSALMSGGHNIVGGTDACGFDEATDIVGVSPSALALGPLADNGGPTKTYALLPGSVAIDSIPEPMCQVTEDQRGEPRPAGGMCDIGAFEVQP